MNRTRALSAICACGLLSGMAYAGQTFTSTGTGNWNDSTKWNVGGGLVPGANDKVIIAANHTITVTDARQVTYVQVNSTGHLDIDASLRILDGDTYDPALVINQSEGVKLLDSNAVLEIYQIDLTATGSGSLLGQSSSAVIQLTTIDDADAAVVAFQNDMTMEGGFQVVRVNAGPANFVNNSQVHAKSSLTILIGASLSDVSEASAGTCAAPRWKASGSGMLQFADNTTVASYTLSYLLADGGTLQVDQNFSVASTGYRVINSGTLNANTGSYGSLSGTFPCTP